MKHLLSSNQDVLARKAMLFRISASKLADSFKTGTFRSLFTGQGIEFSGVREYLRGDDIRTIDWNVTARMGKPFVKLFEEDRDLQLFLVVDRSLSMFTGLGSATRYSVAAQAAALITMAAELNGSEIGAVFFDGAIQFSCKPESGKQRTMLLLARLDEIDDDIKKGSALSASLRGAEQILKRRSLVFVLSDFRTSGFEHHLASLSQKNDVVAIRVVDDLDSELPQIGTFSFKDSESSKTISFQ
ncbi:MAG: DUF58 domain-containing protein [Treponema sp.]|nr:DUF58 domain-containing protein [Treponema sp.]